LKKIYGTENKESKVAYMFETPCKPFVFNILLFFSVGWWVGWFAEPCCVDFAQQSK
jgi:hypothetical protein